MADGAVDLAWKLAVPSLFLLLVPVVVELGHLRLYGDVPFFRMAADLLAHLAQGSNAVDFASLLLLGWILLEASAFAPASVREALRLALLAPLCVTWWAGVAFWAGYGSPLPPASPILVSLVVDVACLLLLVASLIGWRDVPRVVLFGPAGAAGALLARPPPADGALLGAGALLVTAQVPTLFAAETLFPSRSDAYPPVSNVHLAHVVCVALLLVAFAPSRRRWTAREAAIRLLLSVAINFNVGLGLLSVWKWEATLR